MSDLSIVLAGFGGQGILFAGKVIAYAGLIDDREVSWLPSYGPEMRGGTANCSVCLSDELIGSPLITEPDVLIALNLPSYEAFVSEVRPGGTIIVDKTMVDVCPARKDVTFIGIPATQLAEDNDLTGLGNVIVVGKLLELTGFSSIESVETAIEKCVSTKRQDMVGYNKRALAIGHAFVDKGDCQ